jgi:hypothetical protein
MRITLKELQKNKQGFNGIEDQITLNKWKKQIVKSNILYYF